MPVNCLKLVVFRSVVLSLLLGSTYLRSFAQTSPAAAPSSVEREHVGDSPDDPGPVATGLSAELKPKATDAAMENVAGRQGAGAGPDFHKQWTFAALYD